MRKNIDLSDEAVKVLSIQAIENGTNFKNYVEAKLEELAKTKLPPRAKEGGMQELPLDMQVGNLKN